jgi:hypothetical protein
LEPIKAANEKILTRCLTCNGEWKVTPGSIWFGETGCPTCAESGHDPKAPTMIYLLSDDHGAAKVGITNSFRRNGLPSRRIASYRKLGWSLVAFWETDTGTQARKVEQKILKWWRKDLDLQPAYEGRQGDTETVSLERVSLDEIRERIEGELDQG